MVNESFLSELPSGVVGMVDRGYTLSRLYEESGALECGMVIDSDVKNGLQWRITDDASETMRIQFQVIVPVDDRFINKLVDDECVDRATARDVVKSLTLKFVKLREVIETSGGELTLDRYSDNTKMEFFDVVISRDVSVDTLIHLSKAVVEYDNSSQYALDNVGASYI